MNCDACDHDNDQVPGRERREFAHCEGCGRDLCDHCLAEMAIEELGVTPGTAAEVADVLGHNWFQQDEASRQWLCPECFAQRERTG